MVKANVGEKITLKCSLPKHLTGYSWYIKDESRENTVAAYLPSQKQYEFFKHLKGIDHPRASIDGTTGDLTIYSVRTEPVTDESLYICKGHPFKLTRVLLKVDDGT